VKALPPLLFLAAGAVGCGVVVTGDYQGIPFAPDSTVLATADTHELLLRSGAVIPVTRPRGQQVLNILLTAARLDVNEDWRRYPTDTLLEIKRELATEDAIFLRNISLDAFGDGTALDALVEDRDQSGDFDVFVGAALPPPSEVLDRGLGSKIRVRIDPRGLEPLSASISIQREREAGQGGDVATGEVILDFATALVPERLGEANLSVAEAVVVCMHERGPAVAGLCRDAAALSYVDETGIVSP
jgi:hypothetical protein